MSKVSVLGAGGWGMALALTAHSNSHEVTVWSPFDDEVNNLIKHRGNEKLLQGITLPDDIKITNNLEDCDNSEVTVIAVPSVAVRETAAALKSLKNPGIIVNVSKGFEKGTLLRLSQVIEEELPGRKLAVLSGPSHAEEVAKRLPTTVCSASEDIEAAATVQGIFSNECFRVYTNKDVIGVEVGGALKNVIAVCVGFCLGLGLGDNTKAALMTRGLAEMSRLGVSMGADERTFSGLTGIGDLIVTCTSVHSRNNRFGMLVGAGMDIEEALKTVGTVEGYHATATAYQLAAKFGIDMPVVEQCYQVLFEGKEINKIAGELMSRPVGME